MFVCFDLILFMFTILPQVYTFVADIVVAHEPNL